MRKIDSAGVFINILILMIAICIAILAFRHYMDENKFTNGFLTSEANVVIASIQGEKIDEINNKINNEESDKTKDTKLPILAENINANSKDNASTNNSNNYKYYYNQLDNNGKKIYNAIESNIENIKSGTYVINLPSEIGKLLEDENGKEILNIEFQSAWDAIIMDNTEIFFIDVSKVTLEIRTTSYGKIKVNNLSIKPNSTTYLEDDFNSREKVDTAILQARNVRDQIISQLSGNDYEKILQVNDLLVENLEYSTVYGKNAYNIYGALMQRNCVCEGYAEAFKYIMDALNIPCILVVGTAQNADGSGENHEWNYVKIDENWYAMDVTWNDPIIVGGGRLTNNMKRRYVLKGNDINSNHFPNGKISENGMTFSYPELSSRDYK